MRKIVIDLLMINKLLSFFKVLILSSILFGSVHVKAQTELDSLLNSLKTDVTDSIQATKLYRIGQLYTRIHADSSFNYYHKALEIANDLNNKKLKAKILGSYGTLINTSGDYLNALDYFEEALAIFYELKDQKGIASVYNYIGHLHNSKKNYATGLRYLYRSLKLNRSISNELGMARSILNIGNAYYRLGQHDSAIYYHEKALAISVNLKNDNGISHAYNNIGVIHGEDENMLASRSYFQKSLKIYKKNGNKNGMANALNNIGVLFRKSASYDSSMIYYKRALSLWESMDNYDGIAVCEGNIGEIFKDKKQFDLSLEHYQRAIDYFHRLNDSVGVAYMKADIANMISDQLSGNKDVLNKDLIEAIKYCKEAIEMMSSSDQLLAKINGFKTLSRLYEMKGEDKKSLYYWKEMKYLGDSLRAKEKLELIAEMKTKYELQEQEEKLANKIEELDDTRRELSYQKKILVLVCLGLLIISFLFFRIFISNRNLKEAHFNLVRKNKEVLEAEAALSIEKKQPRKVVQENKSRLLIGKIKQYLEDEKPFLDKGFSIDALAENVGSNRTYVSSVINNECKLSFNHFINEFRVKEAIKLLTSEERERYTIESIAFSVGFSSKSSFNPAFKKYTGLTPSMYIKHQVSPQ